MMMKRSVILIGILALGVLTFGQAFAHTPLCACYDNGDGSVTCEGGFSDGSSAAGVTMFVEGSGGSVLLKGKMDEDSEFTFDKPDGAYTVVFDAGEGHTIEIDHGNGIVTKYAHNQKILVKKGQKVERGEVIAYLGNSGRSTAPHLHYEVQVNGVPQNPLKYMLPSDRVVD